MIKEALRPEHQSVLAAFGLADIDSGGLSVLRFKRNEYLFRQGHASGYILLIISGRMKVFVTSPDGKSLLFCFYSGGGILGEVEFATGREIASTSVQAITDVACICIPLTRYQTVLKNNPAFLNAMNGALAAKFLRSTQNSAAAILQPLEQRLCAYISMTSESSRFVEKLTEVSELLGTSYRHLLRTLDNLCHQGVLEKAAKGYTVTDPASLLQKGGADYSE